MIKNLYIENIAVIEKTNVEFGQGLNVLTGETGAGKSILIDAINAVLGKRTPKEIIRTGAQSAFVSAEFEDVGSVISALEEMGIDAADGLFLERSLSASGKNICKINGRPVHVSQLKEVSTLLINIHGQNESLGLMNPERHIDYIDSYSNISEFLEKYAVLFANYKSTQKQLAALNEDDELRARKIDLLEYQINEIEQADLVPGEWEELNDERRVLQNAEKIQELLQNAEDFLCGGEDYDGACDDVEAAAENVIEASKFLPDAESLGNRLYDLSYELKDCLEEVRGQKKYIEADPQRLNEIEERLDEISKLSKKYGSTVEEVLAFLEEAQKTYNELINYDVNRSKLKNLLASQRKEAEDAATEISDIRKKGIEQFQTKIAEELAYLDMPKVRFYIEQTRCELYAKGCDKIEIMISANPGEPPKPISKIASGGELSRIMLAIKTVLSASDMVDTLIFDEIDTGISGSASHKVGAKLHEVSKSCQVICVTHQSQIAAFADSHFLIKKDFADNKTYTSVAPLDFEGRKRELARIISGSEINESALSFAEEQLKNKNKD
ncbi:MAG: DNA repair protein RecN [Oscillospiraceae bacterium]|jgi:DNA repair protein RecN (Recombination protein N)|nr:DNA repair protein RecN [Oscillospiraceae bacterium]